MALEVTSVTGPGLVLAWMSRSCGGRKLRTIGLVVRRLANVDPVTIALSANQELRESVMSSTAASESEKRKNDRLHDEEDMRLEDLPCSLSNIEAICVDTYTPLCILDVPGLISRRFTLCKSPCLIVAAHYGVSRCGPVLPAGKHGDWGALGCAEPGR